MAKVPPDEPMGTAIPAHRDRVLGVGGRLAHPPQDTLVRVAFSAELACQTGLGAYVGLADLAHTLVLSRSAIIPASQARELLGALLALHDDPERIHLTPALGDVFTNREAWLSERTAASGWLTADRARREATTTAFHLLVRQRLGEYAGALIEAGHALVAAAERHIDALMPGYTYLQAAQPTTFGHYLLTVVFGLGRDLDRARALYQRVNRCPAGGGSVNGSILVDARQGLADLLGFEGLVEHTRDAMWQADLPIESLSCVVAAAVNLDRLAEDLMVFSTAEFGFLELDDGHARASKVMPQKKNPYALSHVRGLANQLIGTLTAVAASGRTPSGQVDNRQLAYAEVPRSLAQTALGLELMADVVTRLSFDSQRARQVLAAGFALAADLTCQLVVEAGIDYRSAHHIVGRVTRELHERGCTLAELTRADLVAAARFVAGRDLELADDFLPDVLDLERAVARRSCVGGAATQAMTAMIDGCRTELAEHATWWSHAQERRAAAESSLVASARAAAEDLR